MTAIDWDRVTAMTRGDTTDGATLPERKEAAEYLARRWPSLADDQIATYVSAKPATIARWRKEWEG